MTVTVHIETNEDIYLLTNLFLISLAGKIYQFITQNNDVGLIHRKIREFEFVQLLALD